MRDASHERRVEERWGQGPCSPRHPSQGGSSLSARIKAGSLTSPPTRRRESVQALIVPDKKPATSGWSGKGWEGGARGTSSTRGKKRAWSGAARGLHARERMLLPELIFLVVRDGLGMPAAEHLLEDRGHNHRRSSTDRIAPQPTMLPCHLLELRAPIQGQRI